MEGNGERKFFAARSTTTPLLSLSSSLTLSPHLRVFVVFFFFSDIPPDSRASEEGFGFVGVLATGFLRRRHQREGTKTYKEGVEMWRVSRQWEGSGEKRPEEIM